MQILFNFSFTTLFINNYFDLCIFLWNILILFIQRNSQLLKRSPSLIYHWNFWRSTRCEIGWYVKVYKVPLSIDLLLLFLYLSLYFPFWCISIFLLSLKTFRCANNINLNQPEVFVNENITTRSRTSIHYKFGQNKFILTNTEMNGERLMRSKISRTILNKKISLDEASRLRTLNYAEKIGSIQIGSMSYNFLQDSWTDALAWIILVDYFSQNEFKWNKLKIKYVFKIISTYKSGKIFHLPRFTHGIESLPTSKCDET